MLWCNVAKLSEILVQKFDNGFIVHDQLFLLPAIKLSAKRVLIFKMQKICDE